MSRFLRLSLSLACFATILLQAASIRAQNADAPEDKMGWVSGTVVDATGGVISGVTFNFHQTPAPLSHEVTVKSDGNGNIRLRLPSGTYDVNVSASGFETWKQKSLAVRTSEAVTISPVLQVAATCDDCGGMGLV